MNQIPNRCARKCAPGWRRMFLRGWRDAMTGTDQESFVRLQRDWFGKLSQAGYATPHWPEGWPGGGRSLAEQKVIYEEVARADAPRLILFFVSLYHAACTLLECGSDEQRDKYLPRYSCRGNLVPGLFRTQRRL